jgi:outer membrane receptor protein involved in Fe transport
MRFTVLSALLIASALILFAQSDRGTITGTITDPAGAVIASAGVVARNIETGATYPVEASATGNYTIPQLPAGTYELSVSVPGFKRLLRPGLIIQAAQTIRVDATLEVGNATESVTVEAEAPLLKTESGELSQTIATQVMDALPLLQVGASSSGIRNPYNIVALLPGAYYTPVATTFTTGPTVRINGGVTSTETFLVDGMDGSNLMTQGINQQTAPGMDSIQEWTVQTSNYAAEFGQAGSAVMNVTMKSGTNQYHGAAYNYLQNEVLNAAQPFSVQPGSRNEHIRPVVRRNDYGLTLGGPIRIPKLYDGRNKTFFFFNWEQYLNTQNQLPAVMSLPTPAYRNGDFSAAITAAGNKNLGTDPLNRPIIANTIYDPNTRQVVNGQIVTDPFPNNVIPSQRFDPVSKKIQSMMPLPFCVGGPPCNAAGVVNNWQNTELGKRDSEIPSLKLDELLGARDKLSFYWSRTLTYCLTCYGFDGLDQPISYTFGGAIYTHRERLNYDRTMSPTVLLHLGAGFDADDLGRPSVTQDYDVCGQLGLCSAAFVRPITFPYNSGLSDTQAGGFGSTTQFLGPAPRTDSLYQQFESIASLTWVKANHTFKFGAEVRNGGTYTQNFSKAQFYWSSAQTAMPYLVNYSTLVNTSIGTSTATIGANHIGLPYASFLLGAVDTANIDPYSDVRYGKHQLGFYAQDSWKVTRKLTLDLGLRYDYSSYYHEQYGRSPNLAANQPNPTAGGHLGAVTYEAVCHCSFARNYPWGLGPRVGVAYQVLPRTVLRGGFGIVYTGSGINGANGSAAANAPLGPPPPGQPLMTWGQGVTVNGAPLTLTQIAWPNFDPGFYPIQGLIPGAGPQVYDPEAGRPARQYQWSFSIQRELIRNLVLEASYIGSRGIWWSSSLAPLGSGPLVNYNYLSTAILNQNGLSLNNPADLATLLAPIGSTAAGRFQNKLPFPNFPLTATVAQSLRPFPQFNSGLGVINAPLGDTWYDSLQVSANKRFSQGLQFTFGFTWQKSLDTLGGTPDVQNLALAKSVSSLDQPLVTRASVTYTLPRWGPRVVSYMVRDWFLNGFVYYASGIPLAPPTANTTGYPANLALATINNVTFQAVNRQVRAPGQPLYLHDENCHCFDPNTTLVLNPAAWTNPAPGQYGGGNFYGDFRGPRRPVENLAFGRQFHVRERISLSLRAEFQNILNRTYLNNPSVLNPQTAPVCKLANGSNGACAPGLQLVSGFGSIDTSTVPYQPRSGQLVARFEF